MMTSSEPEDRLPLAEGALIATLVLVTIAIVIAVVVSYFLGKSLRGLI